MIMVMNLVGQNHGIELSHGHVNKLGLDHGDNLDHNQ
jgi:hypothetical protein